MTTLFDDFERTDSRVARQQESQFDFYNRVATRGWSTVRDEVERWFGLYCDDAEPQKANDLRGETPRGARREQHRTPLTHVTRATMRIWLDCAGSDGRY
jgi:hypothetical protein